uniref:Calcium-binding allergen Bet v 3 n=1 Tax=Betula pendula TaxID=3505 RepID=ALLB3_BETPN|nr:RecName: Full=Calcium-binding allergen Bet v 3; AltName: Full=Allergen Bet v III; AltName: Allergen=Bet v 3 [Betula pendula]CAA55854.1 allergen [Betula pendula]
MPCSTEAMEKAGHGHASTPRKRSLSNSSFRLRSESLNTLRLRRIFDLFDKNSDGIITVDELSRALNLLGLETDLSELESTVKSFTREGNIGLQFEDFISLHQSLNDSYFAYGGEDEDDNEEDMRKSILSQEEADSFGGFKVFDEDGDGYISARELQMVLGKLGFSEGSEIDRVEKMIVSVDSNRDGRVDFFEFKDMMRSVLVRSS